MGSAHMPPNVVAMRRRIKKPTMNVSMLRCIVKPIAFFIAKTSAMSIQPRTTAAIALLASSTGILMKTSKSPGDEEKNNGRKSPKKEVAPLNSFVPTRNEVIDHIRSAIIDSSIVAKIPTTIPYKEKFPLELALNSASPTP